jgi:hypothetical protein
MAKRRRTRRHVITHARAKARLESEAAMQTQTETTEQVDWQAMWEAERRRAEALAAELKRVSLPVIGEHGLLQQRDEAQQRAADMALLHANTELRLANAEAALAAAEARLATVTAALESLLPYAGMPVPQIAIDRANAALLIDTSPLTAEDEEWAKAEIKRHEAALAAADGGAGKGAG